MNPRKMKQMMQQMGIDMSDIDAEEVIIRTPDEDLVFTDAEVQMMEAQGQKTYQVVGEPEHRAAGDEASEPDDTSSEASDATAAGAGSIPDSDVDIVVQRTGVSEDEARNALRETDGDLAAAVERLE